MKRNVVTIGINNYEGKELFGCVNDATDWAEVWMRRDADTVQTLLNEAATKPRIEEILKEQVSRLRYRDTLIVCYSGYGTWLPSANTDCRDEAWALHDYQDGGLITDDDMFDIYNAKSRGARIIALTDACYSGSVDKFTQVKRRYVKKHARKMVFPPHESVPKFLPPSKFLEGEDLLRAKKVTHTRRKPPRRSKAVLLSGCRPGQCSYDAWFIGEDGEWRPNGVFSRYAMQSLHHGQPSVFDYYMDIRCWLPSRNEFPQTPQLQATYLQRKWSIT